MVALLGIYVLVSLLSTGVLSQPELAGLKVPSMAGVLQPLIGHWGAALINIGLMISVGGAFAFAAVGRAMALLLKPDKPKATTQAAEAAEEAG